MFDPKYFAFVTKANVRGLCDYLSKLPNQDADIYFEGDSLFYIHVEEDGSKVHLDDTMLLCEYPEYIDEPSRVISGSGLLSAEVALQEAEKAKMNHLETERYAKINGAIHRGGTHCIFSFDDDESVDLNFIHELVVKGFDVFISNSTHIKKRIVIVDWRNGKSSNGEIYDARKMDQEGKEN